MFAQFTFVFFFLYFLNFSLSSNFFVCCVLKNLYDICKKNNPSTYFISHPEQIHQIEFLSNDNVGICGATSTPMWLMLKIKNEIEKQN